MEDQNGKRRNVVVRVVALAAIVLGAAGMAGAKPPKWKFFPKKWYPKKWYPKKWYPKKGPHLHWNLKIVRPAPIVRMISATTGGANDASTTQQRWTRPLMRRCF